MDDRNEVRLRSRSGKLGPLILHVPILSRPDLGFIRSTGPGLGNLLFPLARALIGSQGDGELVFPTMRQLKIGPLLRRENDLRTYGDIFRARDYVEWKNWLTAKLCQSSRLKSLFGHEITIVPYIGMGQQFHDLHDNKELLSEYFWSRSNHLPAKDAAPDIGIHIRQGDFQEYNGSRTGQSFRMPMDWYLEALAKALEILQTNSAKNVKVVIFTDGPVSEISAILKDFDVEFDSSTSAMCSILRLSQSKIIIGSRSTFSLWSSFLCDGTTLWPMGFNVEDFKPVDPIRDVFV